MAPPVQAFLPEELPDRVQVTTQGKRRKKKVNLKKCDLFELKQYNCNMEPRAGRRDVIVCKEVQRLFRRSVGCAAVLTPS